MLTGITGSTGFGCLAILTLATGVAISAADLRLADAVEKGDAAAVRALISQKADLNGIQASGMTALLWAAHNEDIPAAELLLKAGADAKSTNRYGISPLTEAANNGNAALLELFLKAGADVNTTLPEGDTALMLAARTGKAGAVKVLLDHGAKVNAKEDWHGETALMLAAGGNHADVVKMLAAKGAEVNATATHIEIPEMKKGGAQVFSVYPAGGLSALMEAARENSIEAATALLDAKADPNVKSPQGLSAAMIAILNGHWDLAKLLIDRGTNPDDGALPLAADVRNLEFLRPAQDRVDTATALDVIQDLLDRGAKPDSTLPGPIPVLHNFGTNVNGPVDATALYRAAKAADLTVMRMLIAKGADVKHKLKDDATALHATVGIGVRPPMGDAIDKAAKPPQVIEAMQLLLDHGADIDAQDGQGMTPLHGAAQKGVNELVQFLADKGAKLEIKDKRERTPLDVADAKAGKGHLNGEGGPESRMTPHPETAKLLRKLLGMPEETTKDESKTPVETAQVQ